MNLKPGDFCVKIISVLGSDYACPVRVKDVGKIITLERSDLQYDPQTGRQVNLPLRGCSSRLVEIDGGQIEIPNWIRDMGGKPPKK